ncbi:MAG: hypothetical protein LBL94_09665 [Prevotellaceae bacterium]|jgi:hypothetical protein|nr:hypothetical protein [Prevotellaceae bacterium]
MKHITAATALAMLLLLGACIDDKGNYAYRDVNSITISGIKRADTSYLVAVGEYLSITPTLTFSVGEERDAYRYEWHQMGKVVPHQSVRLLSTERNLNLKVEGSLSEVGDYYLMYCVTNLTTGVRYDHVFTVKVQNRISKGYIVLHEQSGGGFEVDMLALFGDTLTHYKNILNMFASGLPKDGKPLDLLCYPDHSAPSPYYVGTRQEYSVWVLTDKSTNRIKAEDFSYAPDYNISKLSLMPAAVLGGKPLVAEKMVATSATVAGARCYMYFNGCWFFFNWSPMPYFFNLPLNVLSGDPQAQPYAVAPYVIIVGSYGAIMFDEAHHRFTLHKTVSSDIYTSSRIYCSHVITDAAPAFKWQNPDYKLLYMGNRTYQSGFAVVKNTSTGRCELLQMSLAGSTSAVIATQQAWSEFPADFDAESVKFFAYHTSLPYLYCATEDRVYRILINASMSVHDITEKVVPAGHKVSVMEFLFVRSPWGHLLTLATYDPSGAEGQNGTLRFYTAEDGTGELSLAKHPAAAAGGYQIDMSWTGFGKIIALDYKQE